MILKEFLNKSNQELLGKLICFPTDTVYGVGASINDAQAIAKIYQIKHRDNSKPLAILCSKISDITKYISPPSSEIKLIMEKYWPGALTIIFKKNQNVNLCFNNGYDSIAFRIPNSPTALAILNKIGPMATTSVNLSGQMPLNDYGIILEAFNNQIDYIIEPNNDKLSKVSSTIIDATSLQIKIIRQGNIIIDV